MYQLLLSPACAVLVSVSELLLCSSCSCFPCQTGCIVRLWVMTTSIWAYLVRNFTNPLCFSMLPQRVVNSKPCNLFSKVEEGGDLSCTFLYIQVVGTSICETWQWDKNLAGFPLKYKAFLCFLNKRWFYCEEYCVYTMWLNAVPPYKNKSNSAYFLKLHTEENTRV